MDVTEARELLVWMLAINYAVLLVWFIAFSAAHGWLYRLHSRWFRLTEAEFDRIHYLGMAVFKILVLVFNLAPILALLVVGRGQ